MMRKKEIKSDGNGLFHKTYNCKEWIKYENGGVGKEENG
jgi:hypothetical protein